jgi:hypothetical protein
MSVQSTISRAEAELANGRLWRAKEILGSSISVYGYSRDLLQSMANVLLRMGDDLEAGKYFLLSVETPTPSQREFIELFLSRCGDQKYHSLLAKFPAATRLENRDDYPEFLRNHLAKNGAPAKLFRATKQSVAVSSGPKDRLFLIGCSVIGFALLACVVVGARTIYSWLTNG